VNHAKLDTQITKIPTHKGNDEVVPVQVIKAHGGKKVELQPQSPYGIYKVTSTH